MSTSPNASTDAAAEAKASKPPTWLPFSSTAELLSFVRSASVESVALLIGAAFFALGFLVTLIMF